MVKAEEARKTRGVSEIDTRLQEESANSAGTRKKTLTQKGVARSSRLLHHWFDVWRS